MSLSMPNFEILSVRAVKEDTKTTLMHPKMVTSYIRKVWFKIKISILQRNPQKIYLEGNSNLLPSKETSRAGKA